jgi:hypothetical protein
LPGPNNRALAVISAGLKVVTELPLCAQFEISDALADYTETVADFTSPVEDLGTGQVAKSFLDQMAAAGLKVDKVIVVAHGHHVGRCTLLLMNDFGIDPVPAAAVYFGYDHREAQPRVTSPEEYIHSDFMSMVGHAPWTVLPG